MTLALGSNAENASLNRSNQWDFAKC